MKLRPLIKKIPIMFLGYLLSTSIYGQINYNCINAEGVLQQAIDTARRRGCYDNPQGDDYVFCQYYLWAVAVAQEEKEKACDPYNPYNNP